MLSTLLSVWTVIVFIVFIAIVFWAWNSKRKDSFDEAARIPFTEEETPSRSVSKETDDG
jgi:cytochrome c oxidase cbb3-type subunit 4